MAPTTRILLIMHHTLMRAGLRLILEQRPGFAVVGECDRALQALGVAGQMKPDVVLFDDAAGTGSNPAFVVALNETAPLARTILLSESSDPALHIPFVSQGLMGVVQKDQSVDVLLRAIACVHAGEIWIERTLIANVLTSMVRTGHSSAHDEELDKLASLTSRECEIVQLIGEGLKNKQISERLFISDLTVRNHLASIFSKLGVSDRLELAIYAFRNGLLRPPSRI